MTLRKALERYLAVSTPSETLEHCYGLGQDLVDGMERSAEAAGVDTQQLTEARDQFLRELKRYKDTLAKQIQQVPATQRV